MATPNPMVRRSFIFRGFGLEDTHSVAKSLRWGLTVGCYGANGSTTTGNVATRRGVRQAFLGQCIWRYHPKRELFEIYAEGGGIPSVSRSIRSAEFSRERTTVRPAGCTIPKGVTAFKNWGKHGPLTNPYDPRLFAHMRFSGDADRFAQTFAIYEGGRLPMSYRGHIVAANALHNRVWASQSFPIQHLSDDRYAADGGNGRSLVSPRRREGGTRRGVYLADWYDSRLSHVDRATPGIRPVVVSIGSFPNRRMRPRMANQRRLRPGRVSSRDDPL